MENIVDCGYPRQKNRIVYNRWPFEKKKKAVTEMATTFRAHYWFEGGVLHVVLTCLS